MGRELTKKVFVYDKNGNYLAYFDSDSPSNPDNRINMMIEPTVSVESNGASTFTFKMNAYSQKWQDIYDAENIYLVDGRKYVCLNESGIVRENETVTVTAEETWKLLSKKYVQAYNVPKDQEGIDAQSVVLLPKSKEPLVVNGKTYNNVPYPRGSAGYNLWALLQGSGWSLQTCDVMVDGFNAAEDFGVFNLETDQKDLLYNIQLVQELYGGILVWDSIHNTVSLRDPDKWDTDYGFEIRKGKNLQTLTITEDTDVITRLYPLGESYLNIEKVNNGKRYLDNFSYTNVIYERNLQNSDIYDQKQLKFWGEQQLKKLCKPRKTVNANIVDVRTMPNREHEVFDINDIATVVYTEDVDQKLKKEKLRIISWSYNVFAPYEATIVLGDRRKDVVDILKQAYDAGNKSDSVIDSNGNIDIGNIWDNEHGSSFGTQIYKYITETEHRLEIKIDDVEGSLADFIVEANGKFATIEALTQFKTETTEALAGLKLYVDENYASLELFTKFKTETTTSITQINQRADRHEARIELNAEHISEHGRNIASLEVIADDHGSRIEANAREINLLGSDVVNIEGDITNIKSNITNINSNITNINGKITNVNSKITNINSEITNIKNLYAPKAEIGSLAASQIKTGALSVNKLNINGQAAERFTITYGGDINQPKTSVYYGAHWDTNTSGFIKNLRFNVVSVLTGAQPVNRKTAWVVGHR